MCEWYRVTPWAFVPAEEEAGSAVTHQSDWPLQSLSLSKSVINKTELRPGYPEGLRSLNQDKV